MHRAPFHQFDELLRLVPGITLLPLVAASFTCDGMTALSWMISFTANAALIDHHAMSVKAAHQRSRCDDE